ncbi:MAG: peptide chain release factor N(5)-glutamine methyltransferase [Gammaproteobacteria bacterium]|nr:peptide chain release factor N(5)-glutamine methyltransferase [Gammaproteobacteria bacterium]
MPVTTVQQALLRAAAQLAESESPKLDAEVLLRHVTGLNATTLITQADTGLNETQLASYQDVVARRAAGEPVAYITGAREFWTINLLVNRHTLVPRPETELVVESVLERVDTDSVARIADLGTGSGAIAIAVKVERPKCAIVACDSSKDALEVASTNAKHNNTDISFVQSHWFDQLAQQRFHIIATNPPYVAQGDPHLRQGDLRFEPATALSSGIDGLDDIREIVSNAPDHLLDNGWLILEHGYDQGESVRTLLTEHGFSNISTRRDLAGHERVTQGQLVHNR